MVTCENNDLYIYTVGLDWSETQSGMSYRYKQNNAFDSLIDSTSVTAYSLNADTSTLALLTPGYDYKIVLPLVGKTFSITRIAQAGQTVKAFTYTKGLMHHKPFVCFNEVVSCYVNDTLLATVNPDPYFPRNIVCISK